jgi:DNA/RNA-binding domain of Phe-tRNA-synthetase-like protein
MIPIEADLRKKFPELSAIDWYIAGVKVERESRGLEDFKKLAVARIKDNYDLARLKDEDLFRCYRDFFWRLGIDPTKIRPASEALIRRVLLSKPLPRINTLVDAYNLASMESGIALAAFDADKLKGKPRMRFARPGEAFLGIGMKKEKTLHGGEIVIEDSHELIAIYPYRDAENTKITFNTTNVLLVACGVPGIKRKDLIRAGELGVEYITRFCGGLVSSFEK